MQITITQGAQTATINITGAKLTRLSAAWQSLFNLPAPPGVDDVKAHMIRELRAIVSNGEIKIAAEAATPAPYDPD